MDTVGRLSVWAGTGRAPLGLRWLGVDVQARPEGALARARKLFGQAWLHWRGTLAVGVALIVVLGTAHSAKDLTSAGITSDNKALETTTLIRPGTDTGRASCVPVFHAGCDLMPGGRGIPRSARPELLAWRGHLVIHARACRKWVPAESTGSQQGSCLVASIEVSVYQRYMAVARSGKIRLPGALDGKGALSVGKGGGLGPIVLDRGGPADVMIHGSTRDGLDAGMPARICMASGGGSGELSSADRASLPGRSTRYRVIWLVCPQCGTKTVCVFYDECNVPICVNASHGPMEILQ
jgi:hypothetical protein